MDSKSQKTFYDILEVPLDASDEKIKEQYEFMVFLWSPDRFSHPDQKIYAEAHLKSIDQAYHILSNSVARKLYDDEIRNKIGYPSEMPKSAPISSTEYYPKKGYTVTDSTRLNHDPIIDNAPNPSKTSSSSSRIIMWLAIDAFLLSIFIFIFYLPDLTNGTGKNPPPPVTQPSTSYIKPTITNSNIVAVNPTTVPTVKLCPSWNEVTSSDVGKSTCVEGKVDSIGTDQVAYYIKFDTTRSSFYFVSYAYYYPDLKSGMCVRGYGVIKQVGNAPVIVLDERENSLKQINCSGVP